MKPQTVCSLRPEVNGKFSKKKNDYYYTFSLNKIKLLSSSRKVCFSLLEGALFDLENVQFDFARVKLAQRSFRFHLKCPIFRENCTKTSQSAPDLKLMNRELNIPILWFHSSQLSSFPRS